MRAKIQSLAVIHDCKKSQVPILEGCLCYLQVNVSNDKQGAWILDRYVITVEAKAWIKGVLKLL